MDKYNLPHCFKQRLLTDAIDSTRLGDTTFEQWSEDYLFSQEVIFPGEREYVYRVASFLNRRKCDFEPRANQELLSGLIEEIEKYHLFKDIFI
jgi:hypothetical protein